MTVNSRDRYFRRARTSGASRGARAAGLAAASCALALLSACSGGGADTGADTAPASGADSDAGSAAGSGGVSEDVTVLQPGRPGEEATTGGPVEVEEGGYNHSDIAFVQMMIPHHAQALEMSELAAERAGSRPVRVLASRIRAAQGPEILLMSSWLEERNLDVPTPSDDPSEFDHGEHGHDPMMGMLTDAEMDALAAARGARFDRLFLAGMIQHHEGALDMAGTVAVDGEDLRVAELAADVDVTQRVEIDRMQDLLDARS